MSTFFLKVPSVIPDRFKNFSSIPAAGFARPCLQTVCTNVESIMPIHNLLNRIPFNYKILYLVMMLKTPGLLIIVWAFKSCVWGEKS
jgi:hypothetical protein